MWFISTHSSAVLSSETASRLSKLGAAWKFRASKAANVNCTGHHVHDDDDDDKTDYKIELMHIV
jgi:hypothetical protein